MQFSQKWKENNITNLSQIVTSLIILHDVPSWKNYSNKFNYYFTLQIPSPLKIMFIFNSILINKAQNSSLKIFPLEKLIVCGNVLYPNCTLILLISCTHVPVLSIIHLSKKKEERGGKMMKRKMMGKRRREKKIEGVQEEDEEEEENEA